MGSVNTQGESLTPRIPLGRILVRLGLVLAVLAVLLFLPAGSLAWPQAWVLLAALGATLLMYSLYAVRYDPALLHERSHVAANVKRWDRVIMGVYSGLLPCVFVLAGLDVGRLHGPRVVVSVQALAWVGLVLSGALIMWTVRSNTFLSRYARIQGDREQSVISSGPYRFVRHPMYLGITILFLSLGPALASWWALAPGTAIGALMVLRTAKEDAMLREELPGYSAYAGLVRWRLVPGLW